MEIHVSRNYDELSENIAGWIAANICETLSKKPRFSIVLTGGNTPKKLYEIFACNEFRNKIDWSRADIFIGDERFVPFADNRSNARMIRETLLNHVVVNETAIHFMQTENITPETSAANFENVLHHYFEKSGTNLKSSLPAFDLVLLGMGEDAHTLSLFPGLENIITEQIKWCTSLWLEEQNMYRITLTAPLVNAAKQIAFLISGSNKAESLHNVLHKKYAPLLYPSQVIKPVNGQLHFFVDEAAMNTGES